MDSDQQDSNEYDYGEAMGEVKGQATRAIIREEIQNLMGSMDDDSRQKPLKFDRRKGNKESMRERMMHTVGSSFKGPMERVDEQEEDYEIQLNKRKREYDVYEPPKFKIIGYNKRRMPIFKMTDLYLTSDPEVRCMIDEELNKVIYGGKQVSIGFSSKLDNRAELAEILAKWENKQEQDFGGQRNNLMNEDQLEQLVANAGEQKKDYFLYVNRQSQPIPDLKVQNNPLVHPNFKQNLYKAVSRLSRQYESIAEYESQEEENENLGEQGQGGQKEDLKGTQEEEFPLWGQFGKQTPKEKTQQNKFEQYTVQEASERNPEGALNEQIIRDLSYVNPYIAIGQIQNKTIEDYNRIELDLSNPNFFLPKLNATLEKRTEARKFKKTDGRNTDANLSVNNPNYLGHDMSVISGSMITGNHGVSLRMSNPGDFRGQMGDDDTETLEQRINKEIRSQGREMINHSIVASEFLQVKFSTNPQDFHRFHRYSFPFEFHFNRIVKVGLAPHKPLKIKGSDLSLNTELVSSYKKIQKPGHLSLSSGEYIMVEYIEESPLLMSNVGMCEKLLLQVSKDDMLEQVSKDIIENQDFEEVQMRRDNPMRLQGKPFKQQCQLWRKSIRENFGDNGKVFLWDNKRDGKLIGSPEGPGVAIMESKLSCVPVVKKKNNPTDFMLVRDGDRWVIRRIDSLYVAGQVQPKSQVFNPDSRSVNTNFMANYQRAFILRTVSLAQRVHIDALKATFDQTNQTSIKKILKSVGAYAEDSKYYTIKKEDMSKEFGLTPEDVALYQSMQHSIWKLDDLGISRVRHTEKIKQILNAFFRRHIDNLEKFAVSKMIKEQLQLTSWYLTESFAAFKNGNAKIDLHGHADPTNGHGGFSFIKKPQKERTEKEDMQQKPEKLKVSGTDSDLRKLKTKETQALLLKMGYSPEQLKDKNRWDLVKLIRQEEGTEYARQERQTKLKKLESEKKEISKVFNRMLRFLYDEEEIGPYQYGLNRTPTLDSYMKREKGNWQRKREVAQHLEGQKDDDDGDDD